MCSLYNLANDSAALIANSVMRLELNLKLMGTAFLSVNGTFNLIDEHQNYALNARMKSTPLQLFNPIIKKCNTRRDCFWSAEMKLSLL